MKRQTKRRIMALVMAALMVVGLIPTGFTAITAKASAGKKYSFEASSLEAASAGKFKDSETVKAGTDDYFTLYMSAKTKIDSSSKTWEDGYKSEQRVNFGGKADLGNMKNLISFKTDGAAKVKVWWAEGGDDNREVVIYNASGAEVAKTEAKAAKNATVCSELDIAEAGTYYLGGDINNNYFFRVDVEEAAANVEPVVNEYDLETSSLEAAAAGKFKDGETVTAGTDNYFTLYMSSKTKIDASSKTWEDGYKSEQRVNFGGKADLENMKNLMAFKTEGTAKVKIWWVEAGDDNREVVIYNTSGQEVAKTDAKAAKNAAVYSELELTEAGTYYLGGDISNNYFFRVKVVDTVGGSDTPVVRKDWADVAAPVIGTITQSKADIDVPFDMVIGNDGADKVVVTMTDEAGKTVDSKNYAMEGENGKVTFTPSKSGKYTFVVNAVRDGEADKACAEAKSFDYVLPLATTTIGSVYSKGNGVIAIEWSAVDEADSYTVEYTADGKNWTSTDAGNNTEATVSGLTVDTKYTVRVITNRGEEKTVSSETEVTATQEAQQKWGQITYGNGANASKDSFTGSANDGKVTIKSASGKLVPASFDGVSFYYTAVPASQNFTLRAKVTVDSWTLSNGQEGFGLMATDKLGGSGWNNSYMAVASKAEYYWNEETKEVTTDSSATKISQKIGLLSQEKTGVTKDNIAAIEANDTATVQANFKSTSYPLEQRYPEAKNIIGNSTNTPADAGNITEMYLTIQKNNTGYFVTYESADGSYSTTKKYYDTEALERIDSDYVYAGFFASRNATATFSDITFKTIDPKDDAAAEERPVQKVAVNTYVQSAKATGLEDYTFLFSANCDGLLTINDADGNAVAKDVEVKADTLVKPAGVKLTKGDNNYKIYFTPSKDYKPNGEFSAMESYETVVIDHKVTYKPYGEAGQSLWVAPDANGCGSKDEPMSIYEAIKYVMPSQQIILKEGTYKLSSPLKIERGINGTADQMIYMVADPDAKTRPVIDFQGLCTGMTIGGDYWYFKGFDVTGSADGQKGLQVSGSHNTLDQIETYHNGNTGLQISRLNVTDTYAEWPSYNLILNCTSYGNADKGYEDADGFAAKLTVGDGNVFDGCIAHHNADDGWDLFAKVQTGSIGSVTIKNSVAYANGYLEDGTNAGNGNGFKMGGDSMPGSHVLENSIAFGNKAKGIDSNSCPDIKVKNCTTINNEGANVAFYTNSAKNTDFEATGVVSFRTSGEDVAENIKPVGNQDKTKIYKATNFYWDAATKTSSNTVAEGETAVTVSADWFVSLDYSSILNGRNAVANIERNADGTINLGDIFKLSDKAAEGVGADFSNGKLTASTDVKVADSVDTEHSYGEWSVVKEATCTEKGVEHRLCSICGAEETREIEALGHEFSEYFTVDKAPTVTEEGSKSRHCVRCDEVTDVTVIAKLEQNVAPSGDMKDDVSVDIDNSESVVDLTDDEIAAIANGAKANIEVGVSDITGKVDAKDEKAVADAITGNETISNKGFVVGSYIDINVFSVVGDSRREISNTSKELTFTVKLADNLINTDSTITRTYKVVRVHGDETAIIDAEFDAATNKITFKSDKFSTYAVIYSDVKNTNLDDKTNVDNKTDVDNGAAVEPVTGGGATATGDKNNTALYVVLIVLSVVALGGVCFYEIKRRKNVTK